MLRKRDNLTNKIFSGRQLSLRACVGLKPISHLIPHFEKLILFEYVR